MNFPIEYELQRTEALVQRCSLKKVFLEISQNSQENTYVRVSFLIKRLCLLELTPLICREKFRKKPFLALAVGISRHPITQ